MNEESLFARLVDLPAEARQRTLEGLCVDDPELCERVEALLAAHDAENSLISAVDAAGVTKTTCQGSTNKHPVIGNYKLLHKLGEGGFGIVYMAEQRRPVRRKVRPPVGHPGAGRTNHARREQGPHLIVEILK